MPLTQFINLKPEALYDHLRKVMRNQGNSFAKDTPIYYIADEVDTAMFISAGLITKSALNTKKKRKAAESL